MRLALMKDLLATMKPIAAALLLVFFSVAAPTWAQAPAASAPDPQVLALLKEVQAQQAQLAQNQASIEAKLTAVAEAVRVARIYSSRSGSATK